MCLGVLLGVMTARNEAGDEGETSRLSILRRARVRVRARARANQPLSTT